MLLVRLATLVGAFLATSVIALPLPSRLDLNTPATGRVSIRFESATARALTHLDQGRVDQYHVVIGRVIHFPRCIENGAEPCVGQEVRAVLTPRGLFFHLTRYSSRGVVLLYQLRYQPETGAIRISRAPEFALLGRECGATHPPMELAGTQASRLATRATAGTGHTLKVGVELARDFINRFGDAAADQALAAFEQANSVYRRQVALDLSVEAIVTDGVTTKYPTSQTTDPRCSGRGPSDCMLLRFAALSEDNSNGLASVSTNTNVIFTDRDFNGTIGIAFIGVVCDEPTFSYALVADARNTARMWVTLAHELGHNLGGCHNRDCDDFDPVVSGIMTPFLDDTGFPTQFSSESRNQIGLHLWNYRNGCLARTSIGEAPAPFTPPVRLVRQNQNPPTFRIITTEFRNGCAVILRANTNRNQAVEGRGTVIYRSRNAGNVRTATSSRAGLAPASDVFIVAEQRCGSRDSGFSPVRKISGQAGGTSAAQYIELLKGSFS